MSRTKNGHFQLKDVECTNEEEVDVGTLDYVKTNKGKKVFKTVGIFSGIIILILVVGAVFAGGTVLGIYFGKKNAARGDIITFNYDPEEQPPKEYTVEDSLPVEVSAVLPESTRAEVTINLGSSRALDRRFFGINARFTTITDARWAQDDEKLSKLFKDWNLSFLRYPGGAMANNYRWTDNAIEDPKWFPGEKNEATRDERTNWEEIIGWAEKSGAELMFVANVAGSYCESDCTPRIWKYRNMAADWVKAVEGKVTYWEIGNENYHGGGRYSMTVAEYVDSFKKIVEKMKQEDPTIKVGALGPYGWFDAGKGNGDGSGWRDTLTSTGNSKFKELHCSGGPHAITSKNEELVAQAKASSDSTVSANANDVLRRWLNAGSPSTAPHKWFHSNAPTAGVDWWKYLIENAGDVIDFLIIHRYDVARCDRNSDSCSRSDFSKKVKVGQRVTDIIQKCQDTYTATFGGSKDFEVILSEYNIGSQSSKNLPEFDKGLIIGEQIIQYIKAGVDIGLQWPSIGHTEKGNPLIDQVTLDPYPSGVVFGRMAQKIGNQLIEAETQDELLDILVSREGDMLTVFFINRNTFNRQVKLLGITGTRVEAQRMVADSSKASGYKWEGFTPTTGFVFTAKALSFGYVVIDVS